MVNSLPLPLECHLLKFFNKVKISLDYQWTLLVFQKIPLEVEFHWKTPACCVMEVGMSVKYNTSIGSGDIGADTNEIFSSHKKQETSYGPPREKTCLRRFANNTGTDRTV